MLGVFVKIHDMMEEKKEIYFICGVEKGGTQNPQSLEWSEKNIESESEDGPLDPKKCEVK